MLRDDIIMRNAVLHITDSSVGMPVLSDSLLELNPELNDFLRDHIYRILSGDDRKRCCFEEESMVGDLLKEFREEELLPLSREITTHLYSILNSNILIPSGDVFFVTYQIEGQMWLAILKMNYREYYVHYTEATEEGNFNDVVKQKAALPGGGKLSEAAFYCPTDGALWVVEKKYEVNGEKSNYFSERFLQCTTHMSQKTKLNIVTKAVEQINRKFFEDDVDKQMQAKSIIHNDIVEQGALVPKSIGEKLYGDIPEIKEEFTEKLEKYHIATEEVKPTSQATIKKYEKQFLTTDTGIEINIPMEEYNNRNHIEFITNPDGTISVLIKNINRLSSK